MLRRLLLLLIGFLFTVQTLPCGNSYKSRPDIDVYSKENTLDIFRFHEKFDQSALMKEIQALGDEIKKGFNIFEDENDRALGYMRVGENQKALEILQRLEKEKPNEYNVVANLGTLYELMGENEKALAYIRKAVSLNDQSHHGSEWFHVQVLEAKLSVLSADWWNVIQVLNLKAIKKDPEFIMADITYQLKERIPFTPKPDIMMASIIDQSAAYFAQQGKREQAWILYKIAQEYDTDNAFSLQGKIDALETYFSKNNISKPNFDWHYMRTVDILEQGKDLIEKGIEIYTGEKPVKKEPEAKKKNDSNTAFIILGSVVVLALGVTFYFSLKR